MRREMRVPKHPRSSTGFLPTLSLYEPQNIPLTLSERQKDAIKIPLWKEALLLSPMLNSLTIAQEYGKIEVRAMGSATRHIAAREDLVSETCKGRARR